MKVLYLYTDPKDETTRYVGMGTETRPYDHLNKSSNSQLGNMINKRVRDNYVVQPKILCIGEDDYIKDLEIKLISAYGRKDLNEGTLFNHTDGGDGLVGYKHTEEHKSKMSNIMSGENNHFYGKTHNKNTKQMLSEKLSGENAPNYGRKFSDTSKSKMSESSMNKGVGKESGQYKGDYITPYGRFSSLKSATDYTNIPTGTIYRWCKKSDTIINNKHIGHSDFLTYKDLGKSFKELGYNFIPVNKEEYIDGCY